MPVSSWSTVAASNTGILTGLTLDGAVMTPPQVDNAFRDMAAQIATQIGKLGFKGADIASASTTNLATATGWYLDITGTTTITAFGTVDAGQMFMLRFTGALTLTYNASSLILPGAASFTTAAGDVAIMVSLGSGNWRCVNYQAAAAVSTVITPPTFQVFTSSVTWTKPTGCTRIVIEAVGGGGGAGGVNGQSSSTSSITAGGGSGFYGMTGVLDVSAVVSAAVTIGAAGTAGTASTNGGNGGSTAITISGTTYTWGGGSGSDYRVATSNTCASMEGAAGGAGTNVTGGSWPGGLGIFSELDTNATSGNGGSNPLGRGGVGLHRITATGATGTTGTGYGAGGGGAVVVDVTNDFNGGAGTAGYMRIWEYYS